MGTIRQFIKRPHPRGADWLKAVCVLVACILYLVSSSMATAAIPKYINFQGRLTDADGSPVADGTYSVTFRLYSAETGGTVLWTEAQSVTVTSGVFNVALGTTTTLDLAFDTQYWFSVQVGSDVEMTPRQRLTAAGYAINADNLDQLTGSQFLRSDSNDTATGQLTLVYPGTALVIQPSNAPGNNINLIDVKDVTGTSKFSVDYEGDIISQNTTVSGTLGVTGAVALSDRLEVEGITTLSGATTIDDSLTVGTNVLTVDPTTGRVGIGTTAPTKVLDIVGDADIMGNFTIGTADVPKDITVTGDLSVAGDQIVEGTTLYEGELIIGADGRGHDVKFYSDTEGDFLFWDDGDAKMTLGGGSELQVSGSLDVDGIANLDEIDIDGSVQIDAPLTIGTDLVGQDVRIYGTMDASILTDGTTILTAGTVTSATWQGDTIATQYGGTGTDLSTAAVGDLLYFSDTGIISTLAPATEGKLLQSNAAAAPSWETYSGTEDIIIVGTITAGIWRGEPIESQYGGIGLDTSTWTGLPKVDSGTWSNITAGTSGHLLYDTGSTWTAATADTAGLVDKSSAQLIAGAKTFSDNVTASSQLTVGGDVDVDGIAYLEEIQLDDNKRIRLGSQQQAELYVDSNNDLYIANVNENDDIYFQVNEGGNIKTAVFIDAKTARIGVGTTNPTALIDVAGDVKLSGRIRQGSMGDLAEMMILSSSILKNKAEDEQDLFEQPQAGDVVIIDEDGGVRRSSKAFATNTVGIISTNPAQILRDDLENAVPVALNGIVPCKVTTENGTIKPGDLLVSSSIPGHAMYAGKNPPSGTIIGKALSRLDEDKEVGVVEVLVMMH